MLHIKRFWEHLKDCWRFKCYLGVVFNVEVHSLGVIVATIFLNKALRNFRTCSMVRLKILRADINLGECNTVVFSAQLT